MKRTYRSIVPVPADVRTGSGGVDAIASAGAFAGIRTRTGCVLGALPLPVGLRKHARIPPLRGRNIRTVHNRSGHSCRIPALMLAVDAHTATRGMTGITGAEPPCSTETVPTACGSADKKRGRPRSRKPFPHWADRLYRIRANPSDGELFASSTHRMMGAGDGPRVRRTNGDVDHRTRPAWS